MKAVIGLILAACLAGLSVGCNSGANPGVIDPGIAPPPPKTMDPGAVGAKPPASGGSIGDPMEYSK